MYIKEHDGMNRSLGELRWEAMHYRLLAVRSSVTDLGVNENSNRSWSTWDGEGI